MKVHSRRSTHDVAELLLALSLFASLGAGALALFEPVPTAAATVVAATPAEDPGSCRC